MTDIRAALAGTAWAMSLDELTALIGMSESQEVAPTALVTDVTGGQYNIYIDGPVVARHDFLSLLFGAVSSKDIATEIANGQRHAEVCLKFGKCPGGEVLGGLAVVEAIRNSTVPVKSNVEFMAASMGYYFAAATDSIVARPDAIVGQIGAMAIVSNDGDFITEMRSANAENKNTEQEMQQILDSFESDFLDTVAQGRNIPRDQVAERFGNGMAFRAKDAPEGMIDNFIEAAPVATLPPQQETNMSTDNSGADASGGITPEAMQAAIDIAVAEAKTEASAQAVANYQAEQAEAARVAESERQAAEAAALIRKNEIESSEFAKARPKQTAELIADESFTAEMAIKVLKMAPAEAQAQGRDMSGIIDPDISTDTTDATHGGPDADQVKANSDATAYMVDNFVSAGMTLDEAKALAKEKLLSAIPAIQ